MDILWSDNTNQKPLSRTPALYVFCSFKFLLVQLGKQYMRQMPWCKHIVIYYEMQWFQLLMSFCNQGRLTMKLFVVQICTSFSHKYTFNY